MDAAPQTALGQAMIARADADADGLPADHPLRVMAEALERAAAGRASEPPTVQAPDFLGAWARARRAWCDYTGEPLI